MKKKPYELWYMKRGHRILVHYAATTGNGRKVSHFVMAVPELLQRIYAIAHNPEEADALLSKLDKHEARDSDPSGGEGVSIGNEAGPDIRLCAMSRTGLECLKAYGRYLRHAGTKRKLDLWNKCQPVRYVATRQGMEVDLYLSEKFMTYGRQGPFVRLDSEKTDVPVLKLRFTEQERIKIGKCLQFVDSMEAKDNAQVILDIGNPTWLDGARLDAGFTCVAHAYVRVESARAMQYVVEREGDYVAFDLPVALLPGHGEEEA